MYNAGTDVLGDPLGRLKVLYGLYFCLLIRNLQFPFRFPFYSKHVKNDPDCRKICFRTADELHHFCGRLKFTSIEEKKEL